mmetsp:Transcript_22428/g.33431  ORF Transcript_22428/g.33431 Transcript_22428/m.33431 type:complete len:108 (+) Transcript_22428:891-1214(+)
MNRLPRFEEGDRVAQQLLCEEYHNHLTHLNPSGRTGSTSDGARTSELDLKLRAQHSGVAHRILSRAADKDRTPLVEHVHQTSFVYKERRQPAQSFQKNPLPETPRRP